MTDNRDADRRKPELDDIETRPAAESPRENKEIGRYTLLQKVGEGGMGEVWLAEQKEPIKRRVALKIIKLGMDTKHIIARFEVERQALAMMNHSCIAKVLDAGSTAQGRPYFVMEYVAGTKITDYCDREKLTTRERLGLFKQVCEGVQHAHQKAIVHRDLKPSNILVSVQDGQPTPKIIDFGLAKATAQTLTDKTMVTQIGTMMGTPEYMSPEQADLDAEDVDTRTDVYSLGVVLYKMLTGVLPFEPKELREAGLDGIRDVIRNRQPRKPSTCLSYQGDRSVETAKLRGVSPKILRSELTGDLDWITMKTLEKERSRRYSSAQALADDLERFLFSKPIIARPPNKIYELRRFAKRHRLAVSAVLVVIAVFLAGGVATTVGFIKASRAQAHAEAEAARSEKISQFLFSMINDVNPFGKGSHEITVEDIMIKALPRIDKELAGHLDVQGLIRTQFGDAFFGTGDFERAEMVLRQAIVDFETHHGGHSEHSQLARRYLCWVLQKSDRPDETIELATEGIEIARELMGKKSEMLARFLDLKGDTYRYKGELVQAEKYILEAHEMLEELEGEAPVWIKNDLALVYQQSNQLDLAENIFRSIYEENWRLHGEEDQFTHLIMNNLATTLAMAGKNDEAEDWFRRTLAIRTRVLGVDHPFTQKTITRLQMLLDGEYQSD